MLATVASLTIALLAAELPDANSGASAKVARRRRHGRDDRRQRRRGPAPAPVGHPAEARHPRAEGSGRLARRTGARRRADRRRALRRGGRPDVRRGRPRRGPARGRARRPRDRRGDEGGSVHAGGARVPQQPLPPLADQLVGRGPASDQGIDVRVRREAAVPARGSRARAAARSGAQPARRRGAARDVGDGARRDRPRGRQHAAPYRGRSLLLGRQGVGRDARGPHADGAPPPARGVRERAGRAAAVVAGAGDHVAARGRAAPRHQRPGGRPRRRRAVPPRRRHRRHRRRAGARGRRRRHRVRGRRHEGRSPGARPVPAAGEALEAEGAA